MYKTIERLYKKTGDKTIVSAAVEKGWITADDYKKITGEELK